MASPLPLVRGWQTDAGSTLESITRQAGGVRVRWGGVRVENPKCEMLTLLWLRSPGGRRRHRKHSGHHYQAGEGYGKWGSRSKVGCWGCDGGRGVAKRAGKVLTANSHRAATPAKIFRELALFWCWGATKVGEIGHRGEKNRPRFVSRQDMGFWFSRGEIFPTLAQQQESSTQTWTWLKKIFLFRGKLYILSFPTREDRSLRSRLRVAQFYTHCTKITGEAPHIRMSVIETPRICIFCRNVESEEKLMFPIWESKVVSPMLSGHFSGSVVVTADLEKNMNSSSSRLKGKEKFLFIKLTISKASLSSLLKIQTIYNCFL